MWQRDEGRRLTGIATEVWLGPETWCPFNSQSTWWFPVAYPLMYLPSRVSFRMTDIWRGFVAQRCLWELGKGIVFHAAEVVQRRNPHALLRDFADIQLRLISSRFLRVHARLFANDIVFAGLKPR